MKRLQNKIKALRAKIKDLREDLFFQSLPKEEKELFYNSLRQLNDFEYCLIINHIVKSK